MKEKYVVLMYMYIAVWLTNYVSCSIVETLENYCTKSIHFYSRILSFDQNVSNSDLFLIVT